MRAKDTVFSKKSSLNLGGKIMDLTTPRVMGILNATPDSFYDGGRYRDPGLIKQHVGEMVHHGMDILDIGGYSSRPGAGEIDSKEEYARLAPVLEQVRKDHPALPVSVDTFRADVAEQAIRDFGVELINDISGGGLDPQMFATIARHQVAYVVMHMRGTPGTMQSKTDYTDIMAEMVHYFAGKKSRLRAQGVSDVIIDPGFGFAKDLEQNYFLLNHLNDFSILGSPLMVGLSRKSMIYKLLGTDPESSLPGSIVLQTIALLHGADIIRVHDVREAVQAIRLVTRTIEK